jgi:hypothetical protein
MPKQYCTSTQYATSRYAYSSRKCIRQEYLTRLVDDHLPTATHAFTKCIPFAYVIPSAAQFCHSSSNCTRLVNNHSHNAKYAYTKRIRVATTSNVKKKTVLHPPWVSDMCSPVYSTYTPRNYLTTTLRRLTPLLKTSAADIWHEMSFHDDVTNTPRCPLER